MCGISGRHGSEALRKARTYTVEMERVRSTGRVQSTVGGDDRERDLNGRVRRERVHTTVGEQARRVLRTAQNLQEHGHCGRDEGLVVDEEVGTVLNDAPA